MKFQILFIISLFFFSFTLFSQNYISKEILYNEWYDDEDTLFKVLKDMFLEAKETQASTGLDLMIGNKDISSNFLKKIFSYKFDSYNFMFGGCIFTDKSINVLKGKKNVRTLIFTECKVKNIKNTFNTCKDLNTLEFHNCKVVVFKKLCKR